MKENGKVKQNEKELQLEDLRLVLHSLSEYSRWSLWRGSV